MNFLDFAFGPSYLFFAIHNFSKGLFNDEQMKTNFVKKSKRLCKARIPNQTLISQLLLSQSIPKYDELTAINETETILKTDQVQEIIKLLTKASEDFLAVDIALPDQTKLNPMDAVYNVLKKALPETNRILITNLDKLKLALPLILPNYSAQPKIILWPFIGISRQTSEKSFNLFTDEHHVIAAVRLGNRHGFGSKLSTLSKSEILNGVFFDCQHRFSSRRHGKLSNVLKKNQLGSLETCIHTPNTKLNMFLQVWNLQGNILLEGLEAQIQFINLYASVIIVVLDDDEDLDKMNSKMVKLFGKERKIIVLIRESRHDTDTDSENEDDDLCNSYFPSFDVLKFDDENMVEMFESTRSLVSNYCTQKSNFTFESINSNKDLESSFDIDLKEYVLQAPIQKNVSMLQNIKNIYHEATDIDALQKCFPLYYSKSPIDESKKIVEHIEHLDKTKVQFFHQHQRGEFEMDSEIENKIKSLRQQQSEIAHQSILAAQYMDDIINLQNEEYSEIQNEKIRLYHKGLSFRLAHFNKESVDIIGFQRELGQRFIALKTNAERRKITQTLKSIVEAGVSIELIDGDTQTLNKEIIDSLLESLRFDFCMKLLK